MADYSKKYENEQDASVAAQLAEQDTGLMHKVIGPFGGKFGFYKIKKAG